MPSSGDPTAVLGRYVADLEFADVPSVCVEPIERAFLDTVGVALAGVVTGAGRVAAETVASRMGDSGEARLLGQHGRASVPDAGFALGTASHCLDYDDWAGVTGGHPSAVLVPTVLSMAESAPVDGREAIAAYLAGFETMAAILQPIHPGHYEAGWHTTGTIGAFGATATAAALADLGSDETRTALNVAASMPSGIQRNFGTMTKPMHVGEAVRRGIAAADLAGNGFTAADEAIAGEEGFWEVYAGDGEPDPSAFHDPREGSALAEEGLNVKAYPSCGGTHPAIAATERLRTEAGVDHEAIETVEVTAGSAAGEALRFSDPETGFQGKFSMEYCVAAAAVGDVTLETFTDEAVRDPAVQRVRERVEFEIESGDSYASTAATVRIRTDDGTWHERTVEDPPGTPENPLSTAELEGKFRRCATRAIDGDRAEAALEFLGSLRDRDDVADLFDHVSSAE